jgi:hypothetical protein
MARFVGTVDRGCTELRAAEIVFPEMETYASRFEDWSNLHNPTLARWVMSR